MTEVSAENLAAADLLDKAIALIEKPKGWMKGNFSNDNAINGKPTCFCADGALRYVSSGNPTAQPSITRNVHVTFRDAEHALSVEVREQLAKRNLKYWSQLERNDDSVVFRWNDLRGVTKREVIRTMKRAARKLRGAKR